MSLNNFISAINEPLVKLLTGIAIYGIAEPVTRGDSVIPGIVGNDGEVKYVGINDNSVIVYHKANGLATRFSPTSKGFGDSNNPIVNGYSMSMIVYIDRKKTKLTPDELFLYIQANMPDRLLKPNPYRQVLFQINTVILNSQQVYDSEYKGVENKLPANHSLMQINYTIESTFDKNCFEKCPEGC